MAGFGGGLGGLGGYAFPTRRGMDAPNSSVVQSDNEFSNAWDDKISSIPKGSYSSAGVELVPGAAGYDENAAQPWLTQIYGGDYMMQPFIREARDFYNKSAGIIDAYSDPRAGQMGASHVVNQVDSFIANPAYQKALDDRKAAEAQRTEAQTRNQQAYDTQLMGNGAIGGVMPSNYSSPTYGQITGQKQGGLGGLGGFGGGDAGDLTGVGADPQSGAYTGGSGAYNPNPFSPGSFQNKNPWGGF